MGTDIHPVVERRVGGKWQRVKMPIGDDGYYDPIEDRNYVLFAILAGVRNGHGLKPISERRGLPDDFDAESPDHSPQECPHPDWCEDHAVDLGEHSCSWVTLAELEAYNWQQQITEGFRPAPLSECVGRFYTEAMPWLRTLGEPDDVRLVFGFDS